MTKFWKLGTSCRCIWRDLYCVCRIRDFGWLHVRYGAPSLARGTAALTHAEKGEREGDAKIMPNRPWHDPSEVIYLCTTCGSKFTPGDIIMTGRRLPVLAQHLPFLRSLSHFLSTSPTCSCPPRTRAAWPPGSGSRPSAPQAPSRRAILQHNVFRG